MVLDASLLNTQYHKVWIKSKWSNPRKRIAPAPTPRRTSYLNRSLRVGQLIYIYIYIYIFTNLISTSIHDTRKKKNEKKNRQEQEIKVSRINARGKKEKIIRQKERKGQPRPTP